MWLKSRLAETDLSNHTITIIFFNHLTALVNTFAHLYPKYFYSKEHRQDLHHWIAWPFCSFLLSKERKQNVLISCLCGKATVDTSTVWRFQSFLSCKKLEWQWVTCSAFQRPSLMGSHSKSPNPNPPGCAGRSLQCECSYANKNSLFYLKGCVH